MIDKIDLLVLNRAKMGWDNCPAILEHLGKISSDATFLYLFDSGELVLTDESIREALDILDISYEFKKASQSKHFIKTE